jgi:hypothetical protein
MLEKATSSSLATAFRSRRDSGEGRLRHNADRSRRDRRFTGWTWLSIVRTSSLGLAEGSDDQAR